MAVTLNEYIEAAKTGGEAGLKTVNLYLEQNKNKYIQQNGNNILAINAATQYGNTALIWAADNGHTAIVTALLAQAGIAINAAGQYGYTALIWAAIKGHTAIVTALLAQAGIAINAANQDGDTALICAAYNGHTAIVRDHLLPRLSLEEITKKNNGQQTAEQKATPEIAQLIRARIQELERLQNAPVIERNNHNFPVLSKISFKKQIQDIYEGELPEEFDGLCCPLSNELMEDPVTIRGLTFDRQYMINWFARNDNPAELKVNWPNNDGYIVIQRSRVEEEPTTEAIKRLIQIAIDKLKEKQPSKNNKSTEGVSSLLVEEKENSVVSLSAPVEAQIEQASLPIPIPQNAPAALSVAQEKEINFDELLEAKESAERLVSSLIIILQSAPNLSGRIAGREKLEFFATQRARQSNNNPPAEVASIQSAPTNVHSSLSPVANQ